MQNYANSVTNSSELGIPNASVTVFDADGDIAVLYSDDGVTQTSNPLRTNVGGDFDFYAADGTYSLSISGLGIRPHSVSGIVLSSVGTTTGTVYVRNFTVADGVTDNTAGIAAAAAACPEGAELVFEQGKTYVISGNVAFETPHKLRGNGCTIKAAGALLNTDAAGFYYGKLLGTYASITPFSLVKHQMTVTLPAGVTAAVGNLIHFKSNSVRVTGYNHGHYAVVKSVSGQTVVVSTAAYAAYQVDSIVIYKGYESMVVDGFTFDWSGVQNVPAFTEALNIRGTNIKVTGCRFTGSIYAGTGCRVNGENAEIERSTAYGFFNYQGLVGGGRVGYGFALYANNSIVRKSTTGDCKHGMASGARDAVIIGVHYDGCAVFEDPTISTTGYFSGAVDFHPNVLAAKVTNCYIVAQDNCVNVRNETAIIENCDLIQHNVGYVIRSSEQGYDGIVVRKNRVTLGGSASSFIGTDSGEVNTNYFRNVVIEDNEFLSTVGNLFSATLVGATIDGLRIIDNKFSGDALFSVTGMTSIKNIEIDNNRCPALDTALFKLTVPSAATLSNIRINNNNAAITAGSGATHLINMFPVAASRDIVIDVLEINDNTLDESLNTVSGYAINIVSGTITNLSIRGNRGKRVANFRGIGFTDVDITDGVVSDNICDKDLIFSTNALGATLTNLRVHDNLAKGSMSFQEGAAGDLVLIDTEILNNTAGSMAFSNRVGSTAWAASNETVVSGTRTTTSGIVVSANSTGNKLRFRNGTLATRLIDNSNTFYATPIGISVLSGSPISWKGGCGVTADGRLTRSAAPTTGAWTINDKVDNTAPVASGTEGWKCITAGSPGTWKTYGAIGA